MIHWSVSPDIFSLGPITLRWYGTLFALGFVFGRQLVQKMFIAEKISLDLIDPLLRMMIASTVIGARLGHCFFYDPAFYLSNPLKILAVWEGGLASHGAAVGLTVGFIWFARKHRELPLLKLMDRMTLPTMLTGAMIRLGNLFNSEILGKPTGGDWGFVFTRVDNVPRHPAQLYESICYAAIFGILYWMYWKRPSIRQQSGRLLGIFLSATFGVRLLIEFVKENQSAFESELPLNMGQLLSLPIVLIGLYLIFRPGTQSARRN